MNNKKKCLIIDGNNLIYRSYHASQKLTWLGENKEIYIFLKIFFSILKKENYEKLFIVFDEGKKTFRSDLDENYKKNRDKTPEQLINHLKDVQNLIVNLKLKYSSDKNFEADDLIASFVKKFEKNKEYEFHILSQDKDLFQLLSENVKILRYSQSKLELFGTEEFFNINKFNHTNFIYYLSLIGDKADNIKGISGIGEKRANYIVSKFKNPENTFLNINLISKEIRMLIEGKQEEIQKNIKIISLVENIELEEWENYDFSFNRLKENRNLLNFCKEKKLNAILSLLIGTQNRTRTDTD